MSELEFSGGQRGSGSLVDHAVELIEEGRAAVARQTNLTLTVTFWRFGKLVGEEVLGSETGYWPDCVYGCWRVVWGLVGFAGPSVLGAVAVFP